MSSKDLKKTLFQYIYDTVLPELKKEYKDAGLKFDKIKAAKLLSKAILMTGFLEDLNGHIKDAYDNFIEQEILEAIDPNWDDTDKSAYRFS